MVQNFNNNQETIYFSRNEKAIPRQSLKPSDIQDGEMIFISHGHFDHIYDVPTISSNLGAKVYCGKGIGETIINFKKATSEMTGLNEEVEGPSEES